ncbi:MAG: diguanylate cyclase [Candidatus Azobacteroides sp.]|nr:diguanylate cyclase [Candidatus Azobacteroides sp.]
MFQSEELKARIEHVKRNLLFYSLYWDLLITKLTVKELEKRIDYLLDQLIDLLKQRYG